MMKKKPKFKIGTKVIVCQDLKTEIEKVEFSEKYQEYIYWFRDENGKLWNEAEYAIESTQRILFIHCCKIVLMFYNYG